MDNYGVIIRHLRQLSGLSVQQAAQQIGRSKGWLSEIENGKGRSRVSETEFQRIIKILHGTQFVPLFKTWVANFKNKQRINNTFDGAVLKFIRIKKNLSLENASKLTKISSAQLSKIENGINPVTHDLRNQIMVAYGYSPTSFKNLSSDPVRSRVVPYSYKLAIALKALNENQIEKIFYFAQELLQNTKDLESCFTNQRDKTGVR
ncbi:MAG: hypothetical protein A2622_07530 [Bdellovibrionales bacterium RIFCSPHIGHO2_01_FULL_40_29]|nr:MAG: hypothetical protein A2622_07530 [Bdellovibrionales bacterium RIFCSPHIGHO2_01_FULL_40_29]OFZ34226.1 MAG: hypothetical protein A3D17_04120 [Bdellovibrionales bacterium RIFCSPHIGHO2_02_FULL_40_15]